MCSTSGEERAILDAGDRRAARSGQTEETRLIADDRRRARLFRIARCEAGGHRGQHDKAAPRYSSRSHNAVQNRNRHADAWRSERRSEAGRSNAKPASGALTCSKIARALHGQGPDAGRDIVGAKAMSPAGDACVAPTSSMELLAHRRFAVACMRRGGRGADSRSQGAIHAVHGARSHDCRGLESSGRDGDRRSWQNTCSEPRRSATPSRQLHCAVPGRACGQFGGTAFGIDEAVDGYNENAAQQRRSSRDSVASLKETRSERGAAAV